MDFAKTGTQLRVLLSLAWWFGGVIGSEVGNDIFTRLGFSLGPLIAVAAAVFSGWLWAQIGHTLAPASHRRGAIVLSMLFLVPLLAYKGAGSFQELRDSLTQPDYYQQKGIGPVDQIALIAQAGGILLAGLGRWRSLKRRSKLPDEVLESTT